MTTPGFAGGWFFFGSLSNVGVNLAELILALCQMLG